MWIDVTDYDHWRREARQALQRDVRPESLHFRSDDPNPALLDLSAPLPPRADGSDVGKLFGSGRSDPGQTFRAASSYVVPKSFLQLSEMVAVHGDPTRWDVLYRVLWRLTHGEPELLQLAADDDMASLRRWERQIRRDCHKMKAFVRFRQVVSPDGEGFVAWHRPDYDIVRLVAPFFARRFSDMTWTLITPTRSAHHDAGVGEAGITFGPGLPQSEAPTEDALEEWWKAYYAAIFNPARLKVRAMKSEMPIRHWPTLPETELIPELLRTARARAETMIEHRAGDADSARNYVPQNAETLNQLADAATACRGCPLHQDATQVVFGEGALSARIVLVGEQPGDIEDQTGRPFVGPAGQVLERVLSAVGLDRSTCYVTNVVKHFKFRQTGRRRLHQTPTAREMWACQPWLEEELRLVRPVVLVCLGATAAKALIGKEFRITKQRGEVLATDWCPQTLATYHPSAILRAPEPLQRESMEAALQADLAMAVQLLASST